MDPSPADPLVVPTHSRDFAVALGVLALLALGMVVFASAVSPAGTYAALAVFLAVSSAAAVGARRWSDRLEVHADHLVERRAGRTRRVDFDQLARMDVGLRDPGRGFDPIQELHLTLTPRDGDPVTARGSAAVLLPAVHAIGRAMAERMGRRLDEGETLYFTDDRRLPLRELLGVVALVAVAAAGLWGFAAGSTNWSSFGLAMRALGVFLVVAMSLGKRVRRWMQSRRNRGLAVSTYGVRPLSEVERRAVPPAGYRTAAGPTEAWIPWSDLVKDHLDAYGLTVDAASRDESIVLTPQAENLYPLHALMGLRLARERRARAPLTGVRVDGPPAEAAIDESAPAAPEATARRRG